jgi:hypothetical protein
MILGWSPGVGDPTVVGWVTAAAYLAVALLAVANARLARRNEEGAGFWLALAVVASVLGLNKQLDLQSLLTAAGREVAVAIGWYGRRRVIQAVFVGLLAAGVVGVVGSLIRLRSRTSRAYVLTILGVVGLTAFVLARAATFHHVDALAGVSLGDTTLGAVAELGSLATIALGCVGWRLRHRPRGA